MIDPLNDGIDHINVYSQGGTALGRFLSNFTRCPVVTEDGVFQSVEGYWYWLSCHDDKLRDLSGYEAKEYGRKAGGRDWVYTDEFKRKICGAIQNKIENDIEYLIELQNCTLPLKHYYIYGGKVVEPKDGKWILDCIKEYQVRLQACDECESRVDVEYVEDPYVAEIGGRSEWKNMCKKCYRESLLDI